MFVTALIIFGVFALLLSVAIVIDLLTSRQRVKFHWRESLLAFAFMLPACALAFFFVVIPILYSLGYSFTNYYLLKPNSVKLVGFDNFRDLWADILNKGDFYHAIKNTAVFVVIVVPLQIALALGLALFCHSKRKGAGIFKVCFFAPVVISLTVTSYLWSTILSPSPSGMMNSLLALFGIPAQDFLRDPNTAMVWIAILSAWQGCGYQMLIFLSGLANVRSDLYEAAALDGASAWGRFVHVTLPALRPTFTYVLVTVFVGACRVMIQPMIMTGYQSNTMTISYFMYTEGYTNRWVGYSSAVALVMTLIIGSITFAERKLVGKEK